LLEIREMIEENKLEAAEKAKEEHGNLLNKVKESLQELEKDNSTEQIEEELEIEKELKEHEDDVEEEIQSYLVYTEGNKIAEVSTKITQAGFEVESAEIVMKPNILQKIDDPELAKKVIEFMEKLEDNPDIQKVYSNFDISE